MLSRLAFKTSSRNSNVEFSEYASTAEEERNTRESTDRLNVEIKVLCENSGRPSNTITTSRFTVLTFFPITTVQLLHPVHNFANFYFLIVGLVQMVPSVSLTDGTPSIWTTLVFVCGFEWVIMAIEDRARHRADRETNHQPVGIIRRGENDAVAERQGVWADVQVGDVVRVTKGQAFPADLLLLRGSEPPGQCWINTKSLDGESDLKLRLVNKGLHSLAMDGVALESIFNWKKFRGTVRCEPPNDKVNDFVGQLALVGKDPVMIDESNVLLRGCMLQNTDYILGLVLSTGIETKINYSDSKKKSLFQVEGNTKMGKLNQLTNKLVAGSVFVMILICIFGATLHSFIEGSYAEEPWYIQDGRRASCPKYTLDGPDCADWLSMATRYFLITYSVVPAALYVSGSIVYMVSKLFAINDIAMCDEVGDEPAKVRQMNLLGDLGQVTHVFSDKTGTLTSNHMEFRRCVIDNLQYGCGDTAISRSVYGDSPPVPKRQTPLPRWAGCQPWTAPYVGYEEAADVHSMFEDIAQETLAGAKRRELMLHMAINHSVMIETVNGQTHLTASSPDEQAFMSAAEYFGFEFLGRDIEQGHIHVLDKRTQERFEVEVLVVFPYESSRKRMSVVVRLPPALLAALGGGCNVRLYCKGADSTIFSLLAQGSPGTDEESMGKLEEILRDWADIALRTLVFASREMPEFSKWYDDYDSARENPNEVQKMKRGEDNEISRLMDEAECQLVLQGATAIEDKLQDGVPELLADLRKAGVKVWMLTGDKVGTAKNIAYACNILPPDADILEITTETFPVLAELSVSRLANAQQQLDATAGERTVQSSVLDRIYNVMFGWVNPSMHTDAREAAYTELLDRLTSECDELHPDLTQVRAALQDRQTAMVQGTATAGSADTTPRTSTTQSKELCLVLDEKAIEYCGTLCKEVLAAVSNGSHSVVACRARKDQKAQMLNLVKQINPRSCCLAIGDGANDVAMIKAGNIGVGIIGKEGMQAVNNSDFAIGQFRFLRSLMLVHGRYTYRKMSLFSYYMFYKYNVLAMTLLLYTFTANVSANRLFIQFDADNMYTLVYTAVPIIVYGIWDQDVSKQKSAKAPSLYTAGIARIHFTPLGFLYWIMDGLVCACMVLWIPINALRPELGTPGVNELSATSMVVLVLAINFRLVMEMSSWSCIQHFFVWGTLVVTQLLILAYSYVYFPDDFFLPSSYSWNEYIGFIQQMYPQAIFWLVVPLGVLAALALGFVSKVSSTFSKKSQLHSAQSVAAKAELQDRKQLNKALTMARMKSPTENDMQRYLHQRSTHLSSPSRSGFAFTVDDSTSQHFWGSVVSRRAVRAVSRLKSFTSQALSSTPPRLSLSFTSRPSFTCRPSFTSRPSFVRGPSNSNVRSVYSSPDSSPDPGMSDPAQRSNVEMTSSGIEAPGRTSLARYNSVSTISRHV